MTEAAYAGIVLATALFGALAGDAITEWVKKRGDQ